MTNAKHDIVMTGVFCRAWHAEICEKGTVMLLIQ